MPFDEDQALQCRRIMQEFKDSKGSLDLENVTLKTARSRLGRKSDEEAELESQPYSRVVIDFNRKLIVGEKVFANDNIICSILPLLKVDKIDIQSSVQLEE